MQLFNISLAKEFCPRRGKSRRPEAIAQHPAPKSGLSFREKRIIIPAPSSELWLKGFFPWGEAGCKTKNTTALKKLTLFEIEGS